MQFSKKLDLLMKTLSITNGKMAKALSVDTSLISRWRNGTRIPGKDGDYFHAIAGFIKLYAKTKSQKNALVELMQSTDNELFTNDTKFYLSLYDWLCSEKYNFENSVNNIAAVPRESEKFEGSKLEIEAYWGIDGKRMAMLRFLSEVAALQKKCNLYLMFDELSHWHYAKESFINKFSNYINRLHQYQCKIFIIYPSNWNFNELPESIEHTLPLYLSEAIKPFYYPKHQEVFFKNTLFIAPGECAVSSDGLISDNDSTTYFFYKDRRILDILTKKIVSYLGYCKPLFRNITITRRKEFLVYIDQFVRRPGNTYTRITSPNYLPAPSNVIQSVLSRHINNEEIMLQYYQVHYYSTKDFQTFIKDHSFVTILTIPTIEQIFEGTIPICFFNVFNDYLFYTPYEYMEHLKHIILLLNEYDNFRVYIDKHNIHHANILVKEDVGAVMATNAHPKNYNIFDHPNITYAYIKHLENIIYDIPINKRTKEYTIELLSNLISQIQLRLDS